MKNKDILIFGIVLLIILQISFIISQEIFLPGQEIPKTDDLEIISQGDVKWEVSENGKEATIFFTEKDIFEQETFVEIKENKFENILSADKSLHPSYIKIDNLGKILEADLTANEKGGDYLINGVKIHLNSGERAYYNQKENKYYVDKNVAITKIEDSVLEKGFFIKGQQVNMIDGILVNGEAFIDKKGYLIQAGDVIFKNMKLAVSNEPVLIADKSFDLNEYKGNWIKSEREILKMKSSKTGAVDLKFLENNEVFNIKKGDNLNIKITNGDGLEIIKRKDLPSLINHKSSEDGSTLITNSFSTFEIDKTGIFLKNPGKENSLAFKGVPFELKSDSENLNLKEKTLEINEEGEVTIIDDKTDEILVSHNEDLDAKIENSPQFNLERISGKYREEVFNKLLPATNEVGLNIDQASEITKLVIENVKMDDKGLEESEVNTLLGEVVPDILYTSKDEGYSADHSVKWIENIFDNAGGEFGRVMLYDLPGYLSDFSDLGFSADQMDKFVDDFSNKINSVDEKYNFDAGEYHILSDRLSLSSKNLKIFKEELSPDSISLFMSSSFDVTAEAYMKKRRENQDLLPEEIKFNEQESISLYYKACKDAGISSFKCSKILAKLLLNIKK